MAPSTTRPRRLTQQERSAATREALVDATIASLVEIGYERSTTSEICERAGLSRGAHLHHFQTRAVLMAAAVEELARRGAVDLQRGIERLPEGEGRDAAMLDMFWRLFSGSLFQVVLELSVHARTDAALNESLKPIRAMVTSEMNPSVRQALTGDANDHRRDAQARTVVATIRGLAVMPLLESRAATTRRWKASRAHLLSILAG